MYQKRLKKERKQRQQVQDQLEMELKRRQKIEEALKQSGAPNEILRIVTGKSRHYLLINLFNQWEPKFKKSTVIEKVLKKSQFMKQIMLVRSEQLSLTTPIWKVNNEYD